MTEEDRRVSQTEEILQKLLAKLIETRDPKERKRLKEQIDALKQTPEGQQDQAKHSAMMSPENQESTPDITPDSNVVDDAVDEYVGEVNKDIEAAKAKKAEILEKVPEGQREEAKGSMEAAETVASAVKGGGFPSAEQIEEAVQKNKL
jgi:hypothetical protein